MAAQESTVPMDDKALMESALATEPVREEKPAEPPQEIEQPRDEHGRFASKEPVNEEPKAEEPKAEQVPQKTEDDDKAGQVPSWRLREVREAREAAERRAEDEARQRMALQQQMQQMQQRIAELQRPKQEPIDFYQDPNAAFDQRVAPLQEQFSQLEARMRLNVSRAMAVATHGAQTVKEMEDAIEKASAAHHPEMQLLAAQMRASDDPVGVAINWHKRSKLMEATGGDVEAFKARLQDDLLKSPEFLAKAVEVARAQAGTSRPSINIPPSLSRATGTGATEPVGLTAADMTDASLYAHATAKGGR